MPQKIIRARLFYGLLGSQDDNGDLRDESTTDMTKCILRFYSDDKSLEVEWTNRWFLKKQHPERFLIEHNFEVIGNTFYQLIV